MKLKENLAIEYCNLVPPRDNWDSEEEAQFACYLAGFEKAREMAIEKCKDWPDDCNYLIEHDLEGLGEEEME